MLLRSSSTPGLSSLIPGGPVCSLSHPASLHEIDREGEFLRGFQSGLYRSVSCSSTALASASSSPISQQACVVDDTRSLDGTEWDFSGDVVPWPRFRRVQSEGDLHGLSRGSALTAAAESFTAAALGNETGELEDSFVDRQKSTSTVGRQWGRRLALRRQSSLSVIPASSDSDGSESDGIDNAGDLMNDLQEVTNSAEEKPESLDYGSTLNSFQYLRDEGLPTSDYLTQRVEYAMPHSTKIGVAAEAGALESEFRLASGAAHDLSAKLASVSGRDVHGYYETGDGERYTTIATGANGSMMVCNSRGCKPVTQSDHIGPMFIAGGFGIGGGVGGGRNGSVEAAGGGSHGDSLATEAYYKRALEAEPGHPLLLRNYARFLHEVKRDPLKAESYYERAILATSPGDGELLALYAKLIWDVYKDEERAGSYFDQAVQASPDNCYVMAAYASFMWSSDADEDTQEQPTHCSGHETNNLAPRYSSIRAA